MQSSRTKKTVYNTSSNLSVMIFKYLLSFVSRTFFIKYLGETYLGVNELLTNILYMLSIAELGLSSAIGFSLYDPLAKKDTKKIDQIMTLFRKLYFWIGILVIILGIVLFFFLPFFINEYDAIENIELIYFLYLLNTASTYFISYKDILITADQESYKLTKINIVFLIISFILELFSLIVLKSFVAYLIAKFITLIIQRIITNNYISKNYENISFKEKEKLPKQDIKKIVKNVKGLVAHKVGDYAVNGTDNLIISSFLNIILVGFYSNYTMLTKVMQNVLSSFYNSIIPSFGNLIAEHNSNKAKLIFLKIDFLGFCMYGFCGILFATAANYFIEIWIGSNYVLPVLTVFLISFNFFLTGIRMASFSVKSAAGIFKEDSWSPFLQAFINLVVSIVLCCFIGLDGVIIGTIVSGLIPIFTRIYYTYKMVFKESAISYVKEQFLPYIFFFIMVFLISSYICHFVVCNVFIKLFVNLVISGAIYMVFLVLMFGKRKEFDYMKSTLFILMKKVKRKR